MSYGRLEEMVAKLNLGDYAAAERIFRAYEPYLRMVVRRQLSGPLRSKLDSMDIVQSAWADVWSGAHKACWHFDDADHLKAFLTRVVRNRLIDRQRQHRHALKREQPLEHQEVAQVPALLPRPSEVAQERELWDQMLQRCPPAHRELLALKRQGLPLAEIAARTGLHEGSVRRILYALARRLGAALSTARLASHSSR